ncbi:4690_t:CDS:1 [Acaulospora morrowiae]|uniref:4690_t:CDS:1 n=1 Tax=Acaulospora morrowiae TaxID=94023 RepID=A0A9N8W8W6_9GLOM|nr:4690_t:CDS:1 [Acaulospora morrowiae]
MKSLFLTGPPRVGKTTLIAKLISHFIEKHPEISLRGFYTEQVTSTTSGTRIGFDVITLDGKRGALARKAYNQSVGHSRANNATQFRVGDYLVDVKEFERLAIPSVRIDFDKLENAEGEKIDVKDLNKKFLIVIDEIGKMESFSKDFENIIRDLIFDKANITIDVDHCCILGTVALKLNYGLAKEIKDAGRLDENVKIWEVTYQNRNNVNDLVKELEIMLKI